MDPALFFEILSEVGNRVDSVLLWNYGEPLLHPAIPELLEGIRAYACKKVISTTGWKLADFPDLRFLTSLDEIIVSINGLTQEVYDMHQNNGNLEKVIRGVKRLSLVLEGSKTRLIMQIIAHKGNLDQIGETQRFADDLGFHEVVIKSFNVMDSKQETFDAFVPVGTEYSRYKGPSPESYPSTTKGRHPCSKSMVINWDGSVNPCCWDYKGKYVLGNVKDGGVYGVWNSPTAQRLRTRVMKGEFLDFCIDCAGSKAIKKGNVREGDAKEGTRSI
jgi:radical SAM protein with 4Fe4S-binding SPASM domain